MPFFRVLSAEILKTNRTVALRIAVLIPLALTGLMIFEGYNIPFGFLLNQHRDLWIVFTQRFLMVWTLLALPLSITLDAALMAGLEHAENQWKNLYALPVPRWTVYLSKLLVVGALVTFSTLLVFCFVPPAGKLLSVIQPQVQFTTPIPWRMFFGWAGEVAGLSLFAIAIQHWVSVRWRSFPVAVGLGLGATITGFVTGLSATRDAPVWQRCFPWSLPTVVVFDPPKDLTMFLAVSAGLGLVVAAIGCWDCCRRDVL